MAKIYGALEVAQLEWFTDAGKPAAASYAYRVIYTTDTKQILVSDGTTWYPANFRLTDTTNSSLTGAAAALSAGEFNSVSLTNTSLTSIGSLSNPEAGSHVAITNKTGASIQILDEHSGATAANRIRTGTGAPVTLPNNASIRLIYTSSDSRWHILGGIGSSTSSGTNFITNGTAEADTSGWATYADAAGSSPVDGTGGSPAVTWTRTTTTPLVGTASFLFTKDAANRQGQGASFDFTIDSAYQAKVLQISFEYQVASGTFAAGSSSADSDITVWVYDRTNNVLIQPSTYRLFASSTAVSTTFISNFQTASNSTSYRIIFHCASTSASAYTVEFDNITVAPSNYVYGSTISDWTSTLTFTPNNFGTTSNSSIWSRRVGDTLQVRGSFQAGTSVASTASITIPYTIDSGKLSGQTNIGVVGRYARAINAGENLNANNADGVMFYDGSDTAKLYFGGGSTSSSFAKLNANSVITSPDKIAFEFSVPILGWASNVQVADGYDNRTIVLKAYKSGGTFSSAATDISSWTTELDTTASFNGTTFTVPASGRYQIAFSSIDTVNMTVAQVQAIKVLKNGSTVYRAITHGTGGSNDVAISGYAVFDLVAGDAIKLQSEGDVAGTFLSNTFSTTLSISRIQSPAVISATETVAASYWLSANFSASTTTPINFDSKEYDTHGAVTTSASAWKFTAPVSGLYLITGFIQQTTSGAASCAVYKNGSKYKPFQFSGAAASFGNSAVTQLRLNAGEYIDIRPGGGQTYFGAAAQSSDPTNIQIVRVGN